MEQEKLPNARVIAFYLPQFHPIPENDNWWGKGFTEWTNVGKAKPLFKGHYQPRVPADLGYYDLRLPEVREQQAEMARNAGIEGFCYWHYWFGNGKRLLERPFNEVLESGKPNFPFCLGWANESWSGIWHGNPGKILIRQEYFGKNDFVDHFYQILKAFEDPRYIRVQGKPLFYIYKPLNIPDIQLFISTWSELAIKNGLTGIHFVGHVSDKHQLDKVLELNFNAANSFWLKDATIKTNVQKSTWNRISEKLFNGKGTLPIWNSEHIYPYLVNEIDSEENVYPTILSGWDNSPRSGKRSKILINYTPQVFDQHIDSIKRITSKKLTNNIIFLKSWNEWAEGNYVEPDLKYGWAFLDILKQNF